MSKKNKPITVREACKMSGLTLTQLLREMNEVILATRQVLNYYKPIDK